MKRVRAFIEDMNTTTSSKKKQEILKKYENDEFIKKILLYTYNPYFKYHVSSKNLKKRSDLHNHGKQSDLFGSLKFHQDIFELLDDLRTGKLTGHDAIAAVNTFIMSNKEYADEIYYIIDRNLPTRATRNTINKVIPKLIPTFDVALALDFKKYADRIDFTNERWFASRKLDGIRCICKIKNGEAKFYSREGNEFLVLGKLADEIKSLGFDDCVLDGEVCIIKSDSSDDFAAIQKLIHRKDFTIPKPRFKIFDILTHQEFDDTKGDVDLSKRLRRIDWKKLKSKFITRLDQWLVRDAKHLAELQEVSRDNGWEGLILRKDMGYEGKRSKYMLKVKKMYDAEYQVVDAEMGPMRVIKYYDKDGNEIDSTTYKENGGTSKEVTEEMLSAVYIEHKGNRVDVGSGFSLSERRKYFKDPSKIIGKTMTVQYFEETLNQEGNYSLRFPVKKHVYENGRNT